MSAVNDLFQQVLVHVRDGHFQRSLSMIAGLSAFVSGLEVAEEHYKGSFGQKIMYTPVVLCLALGMVGVCGAFFTGVAQIILPWVSWVLIVDGIIGFGFHIRGIARKPGGWRRNLVANIVMGPPIFAPLLLPLSGLLGLVASQLLPEQSSATLSPTVLHHIQLILIISTGASALLNGFEALYSHYKSRFASRSQWIPIVLAPVLTLVAIAAALSPNDMRRLLFAISIVAILAGATGFCFHVRGIFRRPGGLNRLFYNFIYGPPPFAPMLFAASGFLGLLATQIGYSA